MALKRPGYRFGMPFLLETKTLAEAFSLASALGLDFIELNSNFPQCQLGLLQPDVLKKAAADYGLFFTLHLDDALNVCDFNHLVREAYVETVLQAVRLAKAAEIPVINLHLAKGNIVTLPDGKHYLFEAFEEDFLEAMAEFRDRAAEEAGDSGVRLSFENTDGWEDYERRAVELALESEVFGLCLDIGHNHAADDRDLPFFMAHKDRLIHMHAHDGKGKVNHQALGSGEIPLYDRLNLAREADATVVLETKTVEALTSSVKWLNKRAELLPDDIPDQATN